MQHRDGRIRCLKNVSMKKILPVLVLLAAGCQPFTVEAPETCGTLFKNWTRVMAQDVFSLTDLDTPDGRSVVASSIFGQVFLSEDGGETWSAALAIQDSEDGSASNPTLSAISMPEPGLIYTARRALYVSEDNGTSWQTRRALQDVSGVARGMRFFDKDRGVVANSSGIYRTRNGGESWNAVLKDRSLDRLRFFTDEIGFAWSLDIPTTPFPGNADLVASSRLFLSTNQGRSWKEVNAEIPVIQDLFMLETGQLFALGLEGELSRSDDGGETWEVLDPSVPGTGALLFVDECTGFVSDYDGAMYGTENAGLTWEQLSPAVTASSPISRMIQSEKGIVAVGNQGLILLGQP